MANLHMIKLRGERGAALLGAVIALVVLLSMAAVMAVNTTSDTQMRGAFGQAVTGFYAAESGLNIGMAGFKNIFLDYNVPTSADFVPRTVTIGSRQVTYALGERDGNPRTTVIPAGEIFAGVNSIQYSYVVESSAVNIVGDEEATVGAEFLVSYIPLFQFAAFYRNDLEILPGPTMILKGRVHTNGNLYLNANQELHIEDDPALGLNTVQVSAGEHVYRGRKNADKCTGRVEIDKLEDTVAPAGDLDPLVLPCNGTATRLVPQLELNAWQGSIQSQIETISIPEPDILDKGSGVFWNKADLRIVLRLDTGTGQLPGGAVLPHTIEVQNDDGSRNLVKTAALYAFMTNMAWNQVNSALAYRGTMPVFYSDVPFNAACGAPCSDADPSCGNTDPLCYTPQLAARAGGVYDQTMAAGIGAPFDLDYRRGGFYNWRERKWMLMLNINVGDLIRWNQQNGDPLFATSDTSHGGLVIYATVEGPASNAINNYGVRVFGGANLALPGGIGVTANPAGLTVVSDQAIYVIGDYNRGIVAPAVIQPWSDQAILPRQPAALIGDSVNILSENYWNPNCAGALCRDGQSVDDLRDGPRDAVTTVVNSAFLGGVDTTPGGFAGGYNGGMENYPRFHETWSNGAWLRYRGSFVSLGEPEKVQGAWCGTGPGCNIYDPPRRDWNFDASFNDVANLPPLTPRFTFLEQRVFAQQLD